MERFTITSFWHASFSIGAVTADRRVQGLTRQPW